MCLSVKNGPEVDLITGGPGPKLLCLLPAHHTPLSHTGSGTKNRRLSESDEYQESPIYSEVLRMDRPRQASHG